MDEKTLNNLIEEMKELTVKINKANYEYYVEDNPEQVNAIAQEECNDELEKFYINSKTLISKVLDAGYNSSTAIRRSPSL